MGDVATELRYVVTTDRDEWLYESFGTNWRMTEMQAAIGQGAASEASTMVDFAKKKRVSSHGRFFTNLRSASDHSAARD